MDPSHSNPHNRSPFPNPNPITPETNPPPPPHFFDLLPFISSTTPPSPPHLSNSIAFTHLQEANISKPFFTAPPSPPSHHRETGNPNLAFRHILERSCSLAPTRATISEKGKAPVIPSAGADDHRSLGGSSTSGSEGGCRTGHKSSFYKPILGIAAHLAIEISSDEESQEATVPQPLTETTQSRTKATPPRKVRPESTAFKQGRSAPWANIMLVLALPVTANSPAPSQQSTQTSPPDALDHFPTVRRFRPRQAKDDANYAKYFY